MTKTKLRISRALFVIGAALCLLLTVILVCNLTIIIKGVVNPKEPPSVMGVTPMVVQSGSMSGSAKDHIETGDLIFIVKADAGKLRVGEIISYMDGDIIVTHRIVKIETGADGSRSFVTKGDANNTEDPAIGEAAVIGLYKFRIAKLGDFAMFLQTPPGMAAFIGLPVLGFILYDILRRQRSFGKTSRETEELRAEIEKLRAQVAESERE